MQHYDFDNDYTMPADNKKDSRTSTTTGTTTHYYDYSPGDEENPAIVQDKLQFCVNLYKNLIGYPTGYVCACLSAYADKVGFEALQYGLRQTARAPRPSLRYLDAIMQRVAKQGINANHRAEYELPAWLQADMQSEIVRHDDRMQSFQMFARRQLANKKD